jgi:hypothetical protein
VAQNSLVPGHLPQRHADIDQAVDLQPSAGLLDRDQNPPRVSHRGQPPKLPLSERYRLLEQVSRDRRQLVVVPRRYPALTVEEDDAEYRWAAFLRQQARVVADVDDLVEHGLGW